MKVVLFCENKYSIDILSPLYSYGIRCGMEILWYLHSSKIPVSEFPWKDQANFTASIQEVYDFNAHVIFVPGNIVPYYLPGVKVQVFHGYAAEKKDHWIIRDYFDLYLTQGPYFTRKFTELSLQHKNFEVVETGWTKQDWIKENLHSFENERNNLLAEHNKEQIVLYAPTFSPSLTSLPKIKQALIDLVRSRDIVLLLKFHPLTKQVWIDEYQALVRNEPNIVWVSENNVTKHQLISDLMISDTSSTVYEFLLLNKPVITLNSRAKEIYWTDITNPSQLIDAFDSAPHDLDGQKKRQWVIDNYDPYMDGAVARRMFEAVEFFIVKHGVPKRKKLNLWRKYTSIKTFGRIKKR